METRATSDQTIVVVLSGEQSIEVFDDGLWRPAVYQAGTVGLTPGKTTNRIRRRLHPRNPVVLKANIYVPHALLDEGLDEFRRPGARGMELGLNALAFQDPLIAAAAQGMLRAMKSGAPDLYAAGVARWLAVHLVCFHAGRLNPERLALQAGNITDRRIERVLELMSERLAEPLSLDDLASEAGVSKFHFVRLFRAKVGETPHAFLVRLRLDAAKSMLMSSDLDIGTIAGRCGFARGAELATAFARAFKMSPLRWREENGRSL